MASEDSFKSAGIAAAKTVLCRMSTDRSGTKVVVAINNRMCLKNNLFFIAVLLFVNI